MLPQLCKVRLPLAGYYSNILYFPFLTEIIGHCTCFAGSIWVYIHIIGDSEYARRVL